MKLLFIGNGNISNACIKEAVFRGHDVSVISLKSEQKAITVKQIHVNINNVESITCKYDAVIDFICYDDDAAKKRINLFKNICDQYIFISTTAFYDRNKMNPPYREVDLIVDDEWLYAKKKRNAEITFLEEYNKSGFPVVIVRPGHTYDYHIPTFFGNENWTIANRIIERKPLILCNNNLWTLTHSDDFANILIPLIESKKGIGKCFHLVNGGVTSWREIYKEIARVLCIDTIKISYINPIILKHKDQYYANSIVYHNQYNDYYDNTKIKNITSKIQTRTDYYTLFEGLHKTIMKYLLENNRKTTRIIDGNIDEMYDELTKKYLPEEINVC